MDGEFQEVRDKLRTAYPPESTNLAKRLRALAARQLHLFTHLGVIFWIRLMQ
jgi:hypothetical protein